MANHSHYLRLGVISFGLALGVTCAILVFLLGMTAWLFGWGVEMAAALSSIFIGYGPTFAGTITGAVWAFAEGMATGCLMAWLYNRFLHRRRHVADGGPEAPPSGN